MGADALPFLFPEALYSPQIVQGPFQMIKFPSWLRYSLVIVAVFAIFLAGAPLLIQQLFSNWLLEHGSDRVSIDNVDFNPFTATLKLEGLKIHGDNGTTLSFDSALLDIAWRPLLKQHITLDAVHLSGFKGIIDNRNPALLSVGGILIPRKSSTADAPASGDSGKAWAIGVRRLSFSNIRLIYLDNRLKLHLDLDTLKLDGLEQWAPDTPASLTSHGQLNGAAFVIKGKLSPFAGTPRYQADVSLKQLELKPFGIFAKPVLAHLAGKLSLDSEVALSMGTEGPQYDQHGDLTFEALQVWLPGKIPGKPDRTPEIQLAKLQADNLHITPSLIEIDRLHHSGLTVRLHINAQGKIVGVNPVESRVNAEPKASRTSTPAVVIKEIVIDGDSAIHFSDDSVKPPFRLTTGLKQIVLEQLDTRQPAQQSPFSVRASPGRYGSLRANGRIQPFLSPPGADIKATLRAIALPPLTSYTRETLGLKLDSGTLDMDLALSSHAGKLDGKATLKLHQLALKNVKSGNSLQSRIPVPMNVALSSLRDKNNTIALEIPVSGDASSPDFDVSDAIVKALSGAISKGAMTYLTVALQPYGAIFTVAKYAHDKLGQIRLEPVIFAPGDVSIPEKQRPYLDKVAELLKNRPKLTIRVCGTAVRKDLPGKLETLAQQRADAVMDYLVEQAGTAPDQLVSCAPRTAPKDPEAEPRAELLL